MLTKTSLPYRVIMWLPQVPNLGGATKAPKLVLLSVRTDWHFGCICIEWYLICISIFFFSEYYVGIWIKYFNQSHIWFHSLYFTYLLFLRAKVSILLQPHLSMSWSWQQQVNLCVIPSLNMSLFSSPPPSPSAYAPPQDALVLMISSETDTEANVLQIKANAHFPCKGKMGIFNTSRD